MNNLPPSQPAACAFRRGSAWILLALCWLTMAAANGRVQAQLTEHQMQAAVLANLAKFVEWPAGEESQEDAVLIGILGHDPFGEDLEQVLKEIKVKGRSFKVKRSRDINGLLGCHIIYFSDRETENIREARSLLQQRPILTVGEDRGFLEDGGMVQFHMENNRVRFAINLEGVEQAGLSIHSQVLRLASEVKQ